MLRTVVSSSLLGGRYGDIGDIVEAKLPCVFLRFCGSVRTVVRDRRRSASGFIT